MSIIAWIVLGAIAGYLAGFLVRGDESLGVIGHIVLGIVGALDRRIPCRRPVRQRPDRRPARHQLDRDRHHRRGDRRRRLERPHGSDDGPVAAWSRPQRPMAMPPSGIRVQLSDDAHRLPVGVAILRGRHVTDASRPTRAGVPTRACGDERCRA